MDALLEKLSTFASLKQNWDSYGSPPISRGAIEQARAFLEFEIQKGMIPTYRKVNVYPTCAGNVGIEWKENGIDITLVFEETTMSIDVENLRPAS